MDALASRSTRASPREGGHLVARGPWRGESLYLVKPVLHERHRARRGARSREARTWARADLILVYDDIDLPLGTVRVRMKGSAGGHNGVRSLIDTLGTDDIRRVKVGIGRPEHTADDASGPRAVALRSRRADVVDKACARPAEPRRSSSPSDSSARPSERPDAVRARRTWLVGIDSATVGWYGPVGASASATSPSRGRSSASTCEKAVVEWRKHCEPTSLRADGAPARDGGAQLCPTSRGQHCEEPSIERETGERPDGGGIESARSRGSSGPRC